MSQFFSVDDLRRAVAAGVIDKTAADQLLKYLAAEARNVVGNSAQPARIRFDLVHMLWYLGALLIIGAMGVFSTLAFSALGGPALIMTAVIYGAIFWFVGDYLWRAKGLTTPGGLLICVAVSMTALLVFGIQETSGAWGDTKPGTVRDFYIWIKSGWLPMELSTIAVAALALIRYRFAFLVAIIAFLLWFVSMDLAAWLVGDDRLDWEVRRKVSILFGLGVIALAWLIDLKQKKADYAFWLHIFGMMTFWGGLVAKMHSTFPEKMVFGAFSVALMMFAVFMNRRVYAVFGAMGLLMLLGDLSSRLFKDSFLFPFALTAIGIAIIGIGLLYLKVRDRVEARVEQMIPKPLAALRPPHARALSGDL